ncbi:MAG: helix-turn-helix domain-containing protein [Haloarculaceae archaeon]
MRELTFELEYEEGVDPLMDMFIEFPSLSADSIASCIRRDRLWRIEHFAGPSSALDTIERFKSNSNLPKEEMTESECGAVREHNVLERAPSTLALYTFVKRLHTCDSVLALAGRHLDLGVVFQTQRRGNSYKWRLLMRSEENVDVFYEHVEENLDDGISLNIGRIGDAERLSYDSLANVSIPDNQRKTLRAAIEHGYYETPRDITVSELADVLDIPQSTVSYRLRQVEARLAKGYIHRFDDDTKAQVQ